jgi:hypothetical protein
MHFCLLLHALDCTTKEMCDKYTLVWSGEDCSFVCAGGRFRAKISQFQAALFLQLSPLEDEVEDHLMRGPKSTREFSPAFLEEEEGPQMRLHPPPPFSPSHPTFSPLPAPTHTFPPPPPHPLSRTTPCKRPTNLSQSRPTGPKRCQASPISH